jgi:hypothetical protein
MTPRSRSRARNEPLDGLEYEIAREQAAALGRAGRRLEAALAALVAFDAGEASEPTAARDTRARVALVAAAGTALWYYVVQREACGLRDSRQVLRDYRVPGEVVARMGIVG